MDDASCLLKHVPVHSLKALDLDVLVVLIGKIILFLYQSVSLSSVRTQLVSEEINSFIPPDTVPSIPDSVDSALKNLARIKQRQVSVKLIVNIDRDEEVYDVYLSSDEIDEYLKFTKTGELVRFLRHNISSGIGYLMDGQELVWELQDITFDDEDITFLKPLVYRSRFYPDEFQYPKTCSGLLASSTDMDITMVVHREGNHYRVEFKDLPENSALKGLEEATFDVFALGLLTECNKLYDAKRDVWYPVELDVIPILDIAFSRMHEYPRLDNAVRTADVSKFDWTQRVWSFKGNYNPTIDEIIWWIESSETGIWRKKVFTFVVKWEGTPKEIMGHFRVDISSVAQLDQLEGVVEALEDLERTTNDRLQKYLKRELAFKQEKSELYKDDVFSYSDIEYRAIEDSVWINLKSDKGEDTEEEIVQDVWKLVDDTKFAGAVYSEQISSQVTDVLSPYGFEEDELREITEIIMEVLETQEVRFKEEG